MCACPPGEQHEGALLAFAAHAAGMGLRVLFLGANTPLDDLLATAKRKSASLIALSFTRNWEEPALDAIIRPLRAWQREAAGRRVIVGGRGADPHRERLHACGFEVADTISVRLPHNGAN